MGVAVVSWVASYYQGDEGRVTLAVKAVWLCSQEVLDEWAWGNQRKCRRTLFKYVANSRDGVIAKHNEDLFVIDCKNF